MKKRNLNLNLKPRQSVCQIASCFVAILLSLSSLASQAQSTGTAADEGCGTPEPIQVPAKESNAEWILKSQIQSEPKLFEHECFKTRGILKSSVEYLRKDDEAHKIAYEDIWFNEGKALGLERKALLDLPQNKPVDIEIKCSPCPSTLENKAAVGTIMRLALDLKINHDEINRVTVPFNSFNAISSLLQTRDFHLLPQGQEAPAGAALVLNLQAESGSARETLYYAR